MWDRKVEGGFPELKVLACRISRSSNCPGLSYKFVGYTCRNSASVIRYSQESLSVIQTNPKQSLKLEERNPPSGRGLALCMAVICVHFVRLDS